MAGGVLPTPPITRGMTPAITSAAMAKNSICRMNDPPELRGRHPSTRLASGALTRPRWAGLLDARGEWRVERNRKSLFGPVHPVAGIAETRHDIAVIIEPLVDRRGPDVHLRMMAVEFLDAFGRGEQARHADAFRTGFLEPVNRRYRRIRRRQHRVEHQHEAVGHVLRRLEVIFDRHERLRVAVEPDM